MAETVNPGEKVDLGYAGRWTYGHLLVAVPVGAAAAALAAVDAPWWTWLPVGLVAGWLFAGFLVMRVGVRMNEIPRLRVAEFADNAVRVLDVGCGSGRLSIAIARARHGATIVGLDNFSAEYIEDHGAARTEHNFRVAGIDERTELKAGDMRDMPFPDGEFDAGASSAAIDHLEPGDIRKTLGEVHRVLKPGGQFLLLVSVPNVWLTIAWGPLIAGKLHGRAFWRDALREAGLGIQSEGTVRTAAMFLTRRD